MDWVNSYAVFADLYDIFVRSELDIPFFLQESGKISGEVLELMSGTGRVSFPLAKAGVHLTCVDLSTEMLAILRRKLDENGLSAETHVMNVCDLNLARQFELIFIPFHSFAEIIAAQDQQRALERIYQHLKPGGRFICTLHNPRLRVKSVDGQTKLFSKTDLPEGAGTILFWGRQDFAARQEYADDQRVVEILEFLEEYDSKGILRSKRLMEVHFSLIQKDEFEATALTTGFGIEALYGDYQYGKFDENASQYMIWILKKPAPG